MIGESGQRVCPGDGCPGCCVCCEDITEEQQRRYVDDSLGYVVACMDADLRRAGPWVGVDDPEFAEAVAGVARLKARLARPCAEVVERIVQDRFEAGF